MGLLLTKCGMHHVFLMGHQPKATKPSNMRLFFDPKNVANCFTVDETRHWIVDTMPFGSNKATKSCDYGSIWCSLMVNEPIIFRYI
jgi:hypothetical protein